MANITSILSSKSVTSPFEAASVLNLKGAIERDHNVGKFRLYPLPSNKRSFFLIGIDDVVGEVYEWTAEEIAQHGLAGEKMYTVPIRFKSVIQSVTIRTFMVDPNSDPDSDGDTGNSCNDNQWPTVYSPFQNNID